MQRLRAYAWPGNIRELQNIIERAVVLTSGNVLSLTPDFGPALTTNTPTPRIDSAGDSAIPTAPSSTLPAASGALDAVEQRHIELVLNQTNWMIEGDRGAAKILCMNPSTLRSRMQKLGIQRPKR
jgi:transcriptional regulator with GAF, ATPase, and Fis domain